MTDRLFLKSMVLRIVLVTLALLGGASAWGGPLGMDLELDPASGIDIKVSADFDDLSSPGALPLRVQIFNRSNRDASWRMNVFSNYYRQDSRTVVDLGVEAGQTRTFSVVVPLQSAQERHQSLNLRASFSGPGVIKGGFSLYTSNHHSHSNVTLPFALSKELAIHSKGPLKNKLEHDSWGMDASEFDPAALPEQWRGFSSLKWLFLSDREWGALDQGVRNGIRQWVGTGGRLVVATQRPDTITWSSFGLPPDIGPLAYGLGDVRSIPWNGKEVDPDTLVSLLKTTAASEIVADRSSWVLLKRLGSTDPSGPLILMIVVGLAVVLGPVNLFYLAPAGRRHRLFVTTPLLSLGGSLLLIAGIIFKDGFGGTGHRFTFIQLLPGANEAVVMQDQVSRTGLLLASAFPLDQGTSIQSIKMIKERGGNNESASYAYQGGIHSGDWFESRSLKVQRLASIRSTRAAVTVVGRDPSGAPQVISSFATPLKTLFYKDAKGQWWQGDQLKTGERVTLKEITNVPVRNTWLEMMKESFPVSRLSFEAAHGVSESFGRPDHFYAVLGNPGVEAIPTLSSIRWEDQGMAMGAVVKAPGLAQEGGTHE